MNIGKKFNHSTFRHPDGIFFDTMGSVSINVKAQVLDVFNETVPRLYEVGRTALGGTFGEIYPGGGSTIQEGTCFGRIAGRNAATEEPWY